MTLARTSRMLQVPAATTRARNHPGKCPSSFDPLLHGRGHGRGRAPLTTSPASDTDESRSGHARPRSKTWDEAMHQAASLARAQGKAPGAIEEAIRDAHGSVLDWRALLRRYMVDTARRDYSWSFPNGRFIDQRSLPAVYPLRGDRYHRRHHRHLGLPAGQRRWLRVLVRGPGDRRRTAARLRLSSCRSMPPCRMPPSIRPATCPSSIALKGRGGHGLPAGVRNGSHEHGQRPGCCLYLTDMECHSYPEIEPDYIR